MASRQITDSVSGVDDAKGILSRPFICGICTEQFDQLQIFIHHFKTHSTTCNKDLHVCECLYAGDLSTDSNTESDLYNCRICKNKFTSICTLHRHILHCSSDGSYIFDNTRKMVYPLTLHCSYFETRESDNCERVDLKSVNEKNDGSICTDISSDAMSRAERVDYILKNVCTLYGKIDKKKHKEKKKVERKRRRPRKFDNFESVYNSPDEKKNGEKNAVDDTTENDGGIGEREEYREQVHKLENDHVVVKVEIEEKNSCDKTGDEDGKHSEGKENSNYSNTNLPEEFEDDENELTDEYTPPDIEDAKKSPAKKAKTVKIKKKTSPRKVQKKQNLLKECLHCGKWLKPYKMKIHLASHSEDRPFKCDQCPKAYKYHGHLQSHKYAHEEVKPYYCEKCGKGYLTLTMLKHHWMMHHADTKPCVCSICGASFITNYKLKRHMMKHTGEKCTQCDLCGMGFATRYNLSVHIQGVHKRNLRFTCKECGRNFMTNYQLKVHMMKHSGERPYKCVICRAEYIERKELRRHLKKQHSLLLEGSASTLSELMDGCTSGKLDSSKDEQDGSSFIHQTYDQVGENREAGTAAEFIEAENESVYTLVNADLCNSESYYTTMKTAGVIPDMKALSASDYPIGYPDAVDYSFQNSTADPGVPLTVQEAPDRSRYNYTLNNHTAKNLSKNRQEKFDTTGSLHHNLHGNTVLVNQDKNRTEVLHDKIDSRFTVL